MPRNAEVIRQWTILREIERSRGAGCTIDQLAALCDVTTRTIRRDLAALQEAGFPLYDERDDDGRVKWRIDGQILKGVETGSWSKPTPSPDANTRSAFIWLPREHRSSATLAMAQNRRRLQEFCLAEPKWHQLYRL